MRKRLRARYMTCGVSFLVFGVGRMYIWAPTGARVFYGESGRMENGEGKVRLGKSLIGKV